MATSTAVRSIGEASHEAGGRAEAPEGIEADDPGRRGEDGVPRQAAPSAWAGALRRCMGAARLTRAVVITSEPLPVVVGVRIQS